VSLDPDRHRSGLVATDRINPRRPGTGCGCSPCTATLGHRRESPAWACHIGNRARRRARVSVFGALLPFTNGGRFTVGGRQRGGVPHGGSSCGPGHRAASPLSPAGAAMESGGRLHATAVTCSWPVGPVARPQTPAAPARPCGSPRATWCWGFLTTVALRACGCPAERKPAPAAARPPTPHPPPRFAPDRGGPSRAGLTRRRHDARVAPRRAGFPLGRPGGRGGCGRRRAPEPGRPAGPTYPPRADDAEAGPAGRLNTAREPDARRPGTCGGRLTAAEREPMPEGRRCGPTTAAEPRAGGEVAPIPTADSPRVTAIRVTPEPEAVRGPGSRTWPRPA